MSSSRLADLSSERMPSEALRTAMGAPFGGAAEPRTRLSTACVTGVPFAAREAAGRAQQVAHARVAGGRALERGGVRRVAAQQPGAVGAAHELVALGELGQRGRDRRAAGAHELAEDAVRQRERDHDAVAADAAPALGQVPEQRLQAPVDARELRDRLRRREPQRALREPVEQRGGDLRVLRHLGGEAAVEHGERGRGEDAPLRVDRQQLALGRRLPGADQVAGAEQLGAHVVGDDQLAGDHAVEHEQADVVGARARQAGHVPRADRRGGACSRAAAARPRSGAARRAARRGRGRP